MPPCASSSSSGAGDSLLAAESGTGPDISRGSIDCREGLVSRQQDGHAQTGEQEPAAARDYLSEIVHSIGILEAGFQWIHSSAVPGVFRSLLVHEEHLTKVLIDKHGGLDVRVVESKYLDEDLYCRKIFLIAPNGDHVANAVLRVDLAKLPPAVRDGVRAERIPFGKLLMDHVAERCVVLKALWRVRLDPDLAAAYDPVPSSSPAAPAAPAQWGLSPGESYGRTISIMCDGRDAAQVLEVLNPHAT